MTSDKSGPVRTASPDLDEDLDDTRVRKDVTREPAAAETPETGAAGAGSSKSSASTTPEQPDAEAPATSQAGDRPAEPIAVVTPSPATGAPASAATSASSDKPGTAAKPAASAAKPAPAVPAPPAPPAPEESSSVPTTGGIWRSAYEAGRTGKESRPSGSTSAGGRDGKAPAGLVSAIGRASAQSDAASASTPAPSPAAQSAPESAGTDTTKSWNRVQAPDAPPAPPAPAPAGEGTDGVRAGAMKAAQAALDAARSAAKKVSSIMPDDEDRQTAAPSTANARPEMHYTAAGVRGTATPAAAAAGQQPASVPTPEVPRPAPAGPRRVRLAISRVDPWSVMKLAFLLAVAIAIMTVVATAVFWSVLDGFGVFTTVQSFVEDAVGPQSNVNLTQFVEFPRVISLATLISICNIVLLTAIATIMAFLYNITAALVGGVHLTLTDD